jgi:hypothetical protein
LFFTIYVGDVMKLNAKKIIFSGLLASLFYVNPSHGMDLEALLGGGGGAHEAPSSESISSMVMSVYVMGDREEMHALFESGVSWSQLYRTQDNQDLKLSFTYTPREPNNPSMPRIKVEEEKYDTLIEHFMEQFSHATAPQILTHIKEELDGFNSKMEFLGKFSLNKGYSESVMQLPGFSPEELLQQFLSEKRVEQNWKKELFKTLNEKKLEAPFTIQYSVPANPGLLKKYEGTQHGEIKFKMGTKEPSHSQAKGRGSTIYTTDLNYGVVTLTMEKGAPGESYRPYPMPHNLEELMNHFDVSLKDTLGTQRMYAAMSYGNPRDNSGNMVH